jgi:uncharacterized protein (DUF1697 family)
MPRYAAFLRGINVVGSRISKKELAAPFEAMGLEDVVTFRASGNVIFNAARQPVTKMTDRIEKGLSKALGYQVAVFLRTESEVGAIADHQPFAPAVVGASKGKLQVVMLSAKPSAQVRKEVLAMASDEDRLTFGDRELYWLPSGGTRDSALNLKTIEKLLGSTTMRTKGTVEQIAAKHFGD